MTELSSERDSSRNLPKLVRHVDYIHYTLYYSISDLLLCTKVFKMRLTRDTSLFDENVVFEGSNGRQIAFDPLHAYSGTLEAFEQSVV
ncbi:hypothetical protein WN51_11822 [Melipona quadrifasciata]|uniref:Uncharacterized protein n=1 Tax=Melipona quadrifasciata TaxID=166423 RepID=A0A0M9A2V7_9HYME|nr:hypothetical protein WN51_11822 [Melipona quadrifasciata]